MPANRFLERFFVFSSVSGVLLLAASMILMGFEMWRFAAAAGFLAAAPNIIYMILSLENCRHNG